MCDCRSRKNVTCSWSRSCILPLAAWFLLPSLFDANAYALNDAAVLRNRPRTLCQDERNLASIRKPRR